jgi:hypothetical protein
MHVVLRLPANKPCLLGKAVLYQLCAVGMCKVEIQQDLPQVPKLMNTKSLNCSVAKARWHCNIFFGKIQCAHKLNLAVKCLLKQLT